MKRLTVIAGVFAVLLMFSQAISTNGTYLNGFSPLTVGRGGLAYGFYDSPTLMMTNPAALSFMPGSRVEADFSVLIPKLHFKNSLNNKDGESQTFPMFDVAYANRYSNSNWSWGIGVFTQGGMGSKFYLKNQLFPEDKEYYSKFGVIEGGPTVVYKAGDDISLGASVHLLYGMMEMKMPFSLLPSFLGGIAIPGMTFGQMFGAPTSMGGLGYNEVTAYASLEDLAGVGVNGNISAQYKVNDQLTVGAGFSTNSTLKLKNGTATMDMTDQFNDAFSRMVSGALMQMGINPANATAAQLAAAQQGVMQQLGQMGIDPQAGMKATYDVQADIKQPAKMGIGFSYRATSMLTVGADVEYILWKTAFDRMALKFSNGDNANINKMMGSPDFNYDFPLDWENTYVIKLGAQMEFSPMLTGRLGFIHGKNPVPDKTLFPVFPAIVENHITAGFTLNITQKLAFNGAYELALNKSQTTNESVIAQEYVNSTSELMEHLVHASILFKF